MSAELRTLVVAPNWVGDAVMALPVFAALAADGRPLVALARRPLAPLVAAFPGVVEVVEKGAEDRATIARLREAGCGEAVVLTHSVGAAWLPFRAGIPLRWGYRSAPRAPLLLRRPLPHLGRFLSWSLAAPLRAPLLAPALPTPRTAPRHQCEDPRELLAAMGVAAPASWTPRLELPAARRERGAERLARARLAPPRAGPLGGRLPGAEFGPRPRGAWQRFAELATALRRQIPSVRELIVAGPKEVWLAVRVYEESGKLHPVVGPELELPGLAGVLAHLDLLVTNDSGAMHLAAALGVPCVALFGPTDPRRTRPLGPAHQVLSLDRWCAPCFRRRCPLVRHRCLRELSVERVTAACVAALAGPRT